MLPTNSEVVINDRVFKIFIDFDGTIAKQDVGDSMFQEFGDPEIVKNVISQWEEGKIGSDIAFTEMSRTLKNFNREKFSEFIDNVELAYGFDEFVRFCKDSNIEITILSDGLNIYIEPFLKKYSLDHLVWFSNKMSFVENDDFLLQFPYTDEECKLCANCKRNHILTRSSDNDYTIYIGDGHSDKCAAQFCDFIFAKDALLKYCEVNRITYFPFKHFIDVRNRLNELLNKKRLKKKLRAELKRKEIYKQG